MKSVLITGATGFVGRHCLQSLRMRGFDIHATYTNVPLLDFPDVTWHKTDLLNALDVHNLCSNMKFSHLLHLAWYTVPGKYWTSVENIRWLEASLRVLTSFTRFEGQRAVFVGTCAEYDWRYGYCTEGLTPLQPSTLYGSCKHSLQLIVEALSMQTELEASWARMFYLYGPHEHPSKLVSSTIASLLRNEPTICLDGQRTVDYLYVQDAADGLVALLDSSTVGPINIASGQPTLILDLVMRIAEQLNRTSLVSSDSTTVRSSGPSSLIADCRRLTEEVGWSPTVSLDEGIRYTSKWLAMEKAVAADE